MQRVKKVDYDEDELYDDLVEEYTAEDCQQFAILTPVVKAELEEAGLQSTDKEVEEALWHYYWDVQKSVNYLKHVKRPKSIPKPETKQSKSTPKSRFDEGAKRNAKTEGLGKSTPNANALARETEKLSVEDKPAKKALNVLKLWQEVKLPSVAFVVIGHVDHGKSTLMGRLLLDSGAVQQRDVDKYQKQAGEMGKSSFALAWVMDTDPEERERGVTVGIAQHHISTEKAAFTILDAPGHRDFVPNMIAGVSMADFAVIVVDVSQLESGMKGQTREHIVLAKAAGLTRVIVAINKLDSIKPEAWDFEVYKAVRDEVATFLRKTGFEDEHVQFTACSGLKGENVVRKGSAAWLSEDYPTLLQALEKAATSETTPERIESSLEMQVADVYRGGIANFLSISGRIASGHVQVGDTIMIQPSGESALIKGIEVNDETQEWSAAGQIPILHLTDMDANHVQPGDMVYCPSQLIPLVKEFEATVNTLQSLLPQRLDLHLGRLHVSAFVKQLTALLNEKGEVIKNKPRVVQPEQRARVVISLAEGIPVGKSLAVILRSEGSTVAYGHVHSAALSST